MRARGTGCVRKPKGSRFWHIYYYCNGRQIRESSKSESKYAAERLLHRRFSEMGIAFQPDNATKKLRYEDIRDSLLDEYRQEGHSLLKVQDDGTETVTGLNHLDDFFAGRPVSRITTDVLRAFVRERKWYDNRKKYPVSNATVNRNLALLRRMMNLARRDGKIHFVPYFPLLKEKPPHSGFVERREFAKLHHELPERLRPIVTFLYLTGRRLGEAKSFVFRDVDFDALEIRQERARTDERRPDIIPLDGLEKFLIELKARRDPLEDWFFEPLFCHTNLRKTWQRVCIRVGFGRMEQHPNGREAYRGLLVQDLRRSAVRNMIEAGVGKSVAMEISGYKQRENFDPYNVVTAEQLHEAIKKVLEKTSNKAKER